MYVICFIQNQLLVEELWSDAWTTASGQSCSIKIMKIFITDFFQKLY